MPYADGTHFATSIRARSDSEQTVMARETGQRAPRAPGHRPGNNVISMDEILSGHDVRTAVSTIGFQRSYENDGKLIHFV